MTSHALALVMRRAAAAVDRQSVLALLGGSVLPVGVSPLIARADKTSKKRHKGCKEDAKEYRALANQYRTDQDDSPTTETCISDIGGCC
jgi:hypothetical protein